MFGSSTTLTSSLFPVERAEFLVGGEGVEQPALLLPAAAEQAQVVHFAVQPLVGQPLLGARVGVGRNVDLAQVAVLVQVLLGRRESRS